MTTTTALRSTALATVAVLSLLLLLLVLAGPLGSSDSGAAWSQAGGKCLRC